MRLDGHRENAMVNVTPACQSLRYENMYMCENAWLDTGVMAIVTPACQFLS